MIGAILKGGWDVWFGLALTFSICATWFAVIVTSRLAAKVRESAWGQRVIGFLGGLLMLGIGVAMEVLQ